MISMDGRAQEGHSGFKVNRDGRHSIFGTLCSTFYNREKCPDSCPKRQAPLETLKIKYYFANN